MSQAGGGQHKGSPGDCDQIGEDEVDTDDDANLLANTWMHSVGATPFRGAHGHWHWSVIALSVRAENLNAVSFNANNIGAVDLQHILEFEPGVRELEDRRAKLNEVNSILKQNNFDFVELEFLTEWILPGDDYRRQNEQEARDFLLEAAEILDANHLKIGNINGYPVPMEDIQQRFAEISAEFADRYIETTMSFIEETINLRKLPGEGEFPISDWVSAVQDGGYDGP